MLRLPNIISRTLRPISEKEYYRAYEWKYLLLFAYPVLYGILNDGYVLHTHKNASYYLHLYSQTF